MLDGWITSILNGGNMFRRLDTNSGDYRREIMNNTFVRQKLAQINAAIDLCEKDCEQLRDSYISFGYLWNININNAFDEFQAKATIAAIPGTKASIPNLKMFDKEITKYRNLQKTIFDLKENQTVKWLDVDLNPVNTALKSWVSQWIMVYLNHLQGDGIKKLSTLIDFMKNANDGLKVEVEDDDTTSLMDAMSHIRDVRVRKEETESLFKPLHGLLSLLKKHSVNIDEVEVLGIPILEVLERYVKAFFLKCIQKHDNKQNTDNSFLCVFFFSFSNN